jgi:hypothetical protein
VRCDAFVGAPSGAIGIAPAAIVAVRCIAVAAEAAPTGPSWFDAVVVVGAPSGAIGIAPAAIVAVRCVAVAAEAAPTGCAQRGAVALQERLLARSLRLRAAAVSRLKPLLQGLCEAMRL